MALMRSTLLWMSRNATLRTTLPRFAFVRRAVSRFMPGERLEDALSAASDLRERGFPTILTHLGENLVSMDEAEQVANHYLQVLDAVHKRGLDSYISVKLTQLGFDLDKERCYLFFAQLARRAKELGNLVWIDMESSEYVEDTVAFYERARKEFANVGLCLQSYLYRTSADLKRLLPLNPMIRLVKGAYREPATVAMRRKRDVDENFLLLARQLLDHTQGTGIVHGIGTHDGKLIRLILSEANARGLADGQVQIQMLYGIQTREQERLRSDGHAVRVLISYGEFWYPWYMRRLAERPANVLFVLKNIVAR